MANPVSTINSSSTLYPTLNSNLNPPTDSLSPQNSYVSLLNTSERPDAPVLSLPQRATLTLDTLRHWSTRTFRYSRQLFEERVGDLVRTEDIELEQNIELLRQSKCYYEVILNQARQLSLLFASLLQTQRSLGQSFNQLQRISGSSDDLVDQLVRNSQCQKVLVLNGDVLLNSIYLFVDKLETLINQTMEDTLITIKAYENARIEFDIYRYDYQLLLKRNEAEGKSSLSSSDEHIQRQYQHFKQRYEKLKNDIKIKMKLLDQNKIEVMKQQLILFHNAIGAYFSVTRQQLNL